MGDGVAVIPIALFLTELVALVFFRTKLAEMYISLGGMP